MYPTKTPSTPLILSSPSLFSKSFLAMSLSRTAVEAIVTKVNTLLEYHLGMAKLGMGPAEVNPKLIEAAQLAVSRRDNISSHFISSLFRDSSNLKLTERFGL